jgi:hypothetical protein
MKKLENKTPDIVTSCVRRLKVYEILDNDSKYLISLLLSFDKGTVPYIEAVPKPSHLGE